jgi:hypothetical protein
VEICNEIQAKVTYLLILPGFMVDFCSLAPIELLKVSSLSSTSSVSVIKGRLTGDPFLELEVERLLPLLTTMLSDS